MKQLLLELFEESGSLDPQAILLRLAMAVVIGAFIFLSYRLSHEGSIYSRKFNVSLVAMTVITTTVMVVIGNNIALSLGMVGALSIVRFRTAIKDSRDTIYIFWTIVVGICCGAGDFWVAGVGSAFTFLVLLLFGRVKNDDRLLLIIRSARVNEEKIEALVFQYYSRKANLRVKNTTETAVEFIYELSRRTAERAEKASKGGARKSITDALYEIGSIEYCNIVTQNDEISS
ncbi:MAG: DUF4956 domain-containing protein [Hydrogeniiclostridium sp.]